MTEPPQVIYEFGGFRLLPGERRLLRGKEPIRLPPKVFDVLLFLVRNPGRVLDKEELLANLWPDTFVEEVSLAHSISAVRKGLDDGKGILVETVPRRGYRFTAPVRVVRPAAERHEGQIVLAVLPFENLSPDSGREHIADGLMEELIAALGQIDPDHFSVIGRTSMLAYRRSSRSLLEIGHETGATLLIESSIRTEGGRIRITSRLIRAKDQVQIWSASYDSEPASVLTFQRELGTTIAEQIRLRLSPERLDALARRHAHNPEAYETYLRGRWLWNHFTPRTTAQAIECFVGATELDPDFALAWAGLADAYASSPIHADVPPHAVWQKAQHAVQRALLLAPDLPESQASLGMLKFWLDWDWRAAEAAFRQALAIDPSYSLAHRMLGIVLAHAGREPDDAVRAMQRARALDPLQAMHHALSAQVALILRDFAAAAQFAAQSTVILPDFWIGYYQLAQACEQRGEHDLALEALAKAAAFGGDNSKVLSLRGYVLGKIGRRDEALAVLRTLESLSRDRFVPPQALALVHLAIGNDDAVFRNLDAAVDAHDVHVVLLPGDPKWDSCRADPRFAAVLRRCGLAFANHAPQPMLA